MESQRVRPIPAANAGAMNATAREARFLTLLEAHRTIVLHVANAYARSVADREDLAQEIVAGAWRSFARYDPARPFSTWLYRVALNTAISWVRRSTRRLTARARPPAPRGKLLRGDRRDPRHHRNQRRHQT
jgi:RNA polymerase sigma-70 factor (ECF subfamily)